MDDNKKKKNNGKRGGPVEPPPPHVSWQGTNLLSSLIQFFFSSSSFSNPPPPPPHPPPHPPSPLTSSAVNAGKYFVCLSAECKMYDGARKSGGCGEPVRRPLAGWGVWLSRSQQRLVAPSMLSVMRSQERQRLSRGGNGKRASFPTSCKPAQTHRG